MKNDKKERMLVPKEIESKTSRFKAIFFIFLSLFFCWLTGFAHSGKARYHVIIDTDGALDDLRAICLFMASADFEILAITTSDGVLSPVETSNKLHSLLEYFGHEGIPTGQGVAVLEKTPPWRTLNRSMFWVGSDNKSKAYPTRSWPSQPQSALDTIRDAIQNEKDPVIFICLGSLTNLSTVIRMAPDILDRIEKVVWYIDDIDPLAGTNYEFDREAAHTVLQSSLILDAVSNRGSNSTALDAAFLNDLLTLDSPYGKIITTLHFSPEATRLLAEEHLQFWDDLLPVYLLHPENFVCRPLGQSGHIQKIRIKDWTGMKKSYCEILTDRSRVKSKVFDGFPDKEDLFAQDVRPLMADIIQKNGREEWRLGVLANELHGHLGIYAVIGTKMGLRAREYFHIGVDDISVLSHAGQTPPLSCMNDGLQVSTGGTIGHGLFAVKAAPPFTPEASFTFKNRTLHLRLKDSFWSIIKNDIKAGIERFDLNTESYWQYVRKLALRYWRDWNRREIFHINANP